MARITKAKQKILGLNAPSDQMAAFGSCKTGVPVYTTDIDALQTAAYEQGWQDATDNDFAPYREEMNGVQYGLSRQIAYLQQEGLGEWIDTVTYYKGSVVKVLTSDSQEWYESTEDENTGNDPTVKGSTHWKKLEFGGSGLENKITNCLLEVPQRIKLELNDGVLTLKAGSQVIVPNGFEADGTTPKFDVITIDNDIQAGGPIGSFTGKWVFGYRNNSFYWERLRNCFSGPTLPTQTGENRLGYNTTVNKIQRSTNGDAYVDYMCSFPICIFSTNSGVITSIDQVFNGMGFIGSTVWVDKGVKGLTPNGRNEDGSLKNIEFTINKIVSSTLTDGAQDYYLSLNEYGTPLFTGKNVTKYDSDKNVIIDTYANTDRLWCFAGECTADINNKITSFSIKLPFRAVDYNDFEEQLATKADKTEVEPLKTSYVIQKYQNGTSGYRIYSDGYCEQWGLAVGGGDVDLTVTFLKPFKDNNYTLNASMITTSTAKLSSLAHISVVSKTNTSFVTRVNSNIGLTKSWLACGYIK